MKLYVSADMEGTAGVCAWSQVDPANLHEYPTYRRYMSREVRAAIDGARTAGAGEVVVNDSHWDMRNVLWDELPDDVRVISGIRKPLSMVEGGFDCDAAFFTGYHGRSGDADAVLAHTYTDAVMYDVRVNGTSVSEATLNAAVLGERGVPVLLVTGDDTIVTSVTRAMPWVTGVIVKRSIGYFSADSLTPATACRAIHDAAAAAIAAYPNAHPFRFDPPISLEIDCVKVEQADFIALLPRFERLGARTVRFSGETMAEAFDAFLVAMRLGGAANAPS